MGASETLLAHQTRRLYRCPPQRVTEWLLAETAHVIPRTLADRYEVVGEIGRGGMATVYRARDLRHGVDVAIKVLRFELASSSFAERFAREIRLTARLQHPNILPVLDSGVVGELPYYVMPFVDGETLQALLRRTEQLAIDEALRLTGEIADALSYAHRQGVVHRDIKPSNILISRGHAVVADFGIARALDAAAEDRITESGLALGTAHYMSPEQASTGAVDGRSDTYSLGCMLYEMLAGSPPFVGPTVSTIMARHATDPMPPLRTVRTTVTPALEEVIRKALSKAPADRFADPSDFKVAMERAALDRRRLTRREVVRRWAGIGVATAAVLAVITWQMSRGRAGSLDVNRVMVFPLAVAADSRIPSDLGENVATMIGGVLDGTGPLRWIDAWPLLSENDARTVPDERASALARSKRCAYFITGRVFASGDSVHSVLSLHDVEGDSTLATAPAAGTGPDALHLALVSVNRILPKLIPGVPASATAGWQDRNPKAIASFLLAEAQHRRAQFSAAVSSYRDAVAADSSFGLAAIRGAQAASWDHRPDQASEFITVATRQALPGRYADFARGYRAYLDGRADSAAAAFQRTLAADPGMAAAWHQLGEVYTHLLPRGGNADSMAAAAFSAAHELDSAATSGLFHLIQILLRKGDIDGARPLVRRFLTASLDTILAREAEIMLSCLERGPAQVDWTHLAKVRPLPLYSASSALAAGASQSRCAQAGFEAILRADTASEPNADGRRWNSLIGLTSLQLAQGRSLEASQEIDVFAARWRYGTSLFLLAAPFDTLFQRRARTLADADAKQWGVNYERLPYATRLWELGLLEVASGRHEVAREIASMLRRRADSTRAERDALLARSLGIHLALASHDSGSAFDTLRAMVPSSAPTSVAAYDEAWPVAGERLELARIYLARGQPRLALDLATVIDSPGAVFHVFWVPQSLTIRLQAAAAMGDAPLEARLQRRIAALREE